MKKRPYVGIEADVAAFDVDDRDQLIVRASATRGDYLHSTTALLSPTNEVPEWNDANNALVGDGLSMVTTRCLYGGFSFWNEDSCD